MKRLVKMFMLVTLMVPAFVFGAHAQTKVVADTSRHMHSKLKATLTPDQKAMLKENHKKQKEAMASFKATLNTDQKAILKDKALSHKERKAKLETTLTAAQKNMLSANKASRVANHKAFVATLTDPQKADMKARHGKGGSKHHKTDEA